MIEEIQHYNPRRGILTKSQQYKIRKLVEHNCVERTGPDTWRCKPIPGYNSTTYTINRKYGMYACTCQYWTMHNGLQECSHIGAMILAGGLTMPYMAEKQLTF